MEHLSKFQIIKNNLKLKRLLPHGVRDVFSGVLLNYPVMAQYLQPDSEILKNPNFESGIVMILNKEFSSMSRSEKFATDLFHPQMGQFT